MAYNRKQQDMSPSASPIKKKSKSPNTSDMVDKMANAVAQFEDILRTELTGMRNKFASHMTVVKLLCSKLDLLTGEMREQKKVVADHDRRVATLEQQVVDLQDRDRCSNLRLVGLPDGSEKDDPVGFLKRLLPMWLPSLMGKEIEVERAQITYPFSVWEAVTVVSPFHGYEFCNVPYSR
ncbi:LINE-1 type transposase domain-containing 1 [Labeo rohita]|uniref:LINE-1 type transposase domain-containing 1 n=1 Tax=Labeo rohita TaxID=84645 RepID=A0A498M466_LABRO|nr:LINE-1 type transposase domain-containing 1 [Labeo rohita]